MQKAGTTYAFWLRFWNLARQVVSHLGAHDPAKARFQERVADELILEIQRRVETHAQEFIDKKALAKIIISNFLFDKGKICTVCKAAQILPNDVFYLEGSGTLIREHFDDLNTRAHESIKRHDAQQRRVLGLVAS